MRSEPDLGRETSAWETVGHVEDPGNLHIRARLQTVITWSLRVGRQNVT